MKLTEGEGQCGHDVADGGCIGGQVESALAERDPSPQAQEDRPGEGFGESSGVRPRPELWQIRFDNNTA